MAIEEIKALIAATMRFLIRKKDTSIVIRFIIKVLT